MAIYTGVADENGDFEIPFSSNYTSGQKVTVTAEKDSATKSIELYAPSDVVVGGDGAIQFSGSLLNYPENVGDVIFTKIKNYSASCFYGVPFTGIEIHDAISIGVNAFRASSAHPAKHVRLLSPELLSVGNTAFYGLTNCTELIIEHVETIGMQSFFNMSKITTLYLPEGLKTVGSGAFYALTSLLSADLPSTLESLGANACYSWNSCNTITIRSVTPPAIATDTFANLKATCIFKVPAASVAAYQAAPNWSAYAARIQAI